MSLIVKICGLSTPDTLDAALDAGADMVGFVSFARSPRHIDLAAMAKLADLARGRAEIVTLIVDADAEHIANIQKQVRPDWLQLHGSETAETVAAIKRFSGLRIMKALPIAERGDLEATGHYAAVADRLLFDARPPKDATRPGGLGVPFDWSLLRGLDLPVPFMVSGGLHKGNVADAIRIAQPAGVDVSSGVERSPGIKDSDMIRSFIDAARAADRALVTDR